MFDVVSEGPYICVNCGNDQNKNLVKIYGKKENSEQSGSPNFSTADWSHLKLSECSQCGLFVDEYIQLDNCILVLDAILLKTSFFRHVLLNCKIPSNIPFKLMVVFGFCDAYKRWSSIQGTVDSTELELMFYLNFLRSLLENLFLYLSIYFAFKLITGPLPVKNFLSCLVICSYGKLFKVPAVIYASELKQVTDSLLEVYYLVSLVKCCCVKTNSDVKFFEVFLIVISLYTIHSTCLQQLPWWTQIFCLPSATEKIN